MSKGPALKDYMQGWN